MFWPLATFDQRTFSMQGDSLSDLQKDGIITALATMLVGLLWIVSCVRSQEELDWKMQSFARYHTALSGESMLLLHKQVVTLQRKLFSSSPFYGSQNQHFQALPIGFMCHHKLPFCYNTRVRNDDSIRAVSS